MGEVNIFIPKNAFERVVDYENKVARDFGRTTVSDVLKTCLNRGYYSSWMLPKRYVAFGIKHVKDNKIFIGIRFARMWSNGYSYTYIGSDRDMPSILLKNGFHAYNNFYYDRKSLKQAIKKIKRLLSEDLVEKF